MRAETQDDQPKGLCQESRDQPMQEPGVTTASLLKRPSRAHGTTGHALPTVLPPFPSVQAHPHPAWGHQPARPDT